MKPGEQESAGDESRQEPDGPGTLEAARVEAARVMAEAELQAAALRSQAAGIRFEARTGQPLPPTGQETPDPVRGSLTDVALRRLDQIDTHVSATEAELIRFLEGQMAGSGEQRTEASPATATTTRMPVVDESTGRTAGEHERNGSGLAPAPIPSVASHSRWARWALVLLLALLTIGGATVFLAAV